MTKKLVVNWLVVIGFVVISIAGCRNEGSSEGGQGTGLYATYECGGVTLQDASIVDEYDELELLLDYRQFSIDRRCRDEGDIRYFIGYKFIELNEEIAKTLNKDIMSTMLVAASESAAAVEFCSQKDCEIGMKDMQALKAYAHLLVGKGDLAQSSFNYLLANGWVPTDRTVFYPYVGEGYLFMLLDSGEYEEVRSFLSGVEDGVTEFDAVRIRLEALTSANLEQFYTEKIRVVEKDPNLLFGLCGGLSERGARALAFDCFQKLLRLRSANEYAKETARQEIAEIEGARRQHRTELPIE